IQMYAYPQTAIPATGNNCAMAYGTQYYLNMRFIANDKTTQTCLSTNGLCTLIVNFNSNAVFP
ncbi:MAG TPA: hypothetical protein VGI57_15885, partial [Usitatibacter sp.]